jgi:RNA polymerase sigma-70 factor, ECF subfamily
MQLNVTSTLPGEVTQLLHDARNGDPEAMHRIVPLVYEHLRAIAARKLRGESGPRTLQPTALVHEALMKLLRRGGTDAEDRKHFVSIACRAMRQVLIDDARRRAAAKRPGGREQVTFRDLDHAAEVGLSADDLLALDEALDGLEARQRQIVECRFFGGMEEREIAEALGITERTVRRDWVKARAWLYQALYGGTSN